MSAARSPPRGYPLGLLLPGTDGGKPEGLRGESPLGDILPGGAPTESCPQAQRLGIRTLC
eukprot:991345-Amphidinium_carterae.1